MDQYDKLEFNPFTLKKGEKIWEKYPKLSKRKAFCSLPEEVADFVLEDLNKLIKFTILFIDPLSPFYDIKDFDSRLKSVLKSLKFQANFRFYKEIKNNTDFWHYMMYEYFTYVNHHLYEQWFTLKMSLHHMNMDLRGKKIKPSERNRAMKDIAEFTDSIIQLEYRLFQDDRTKKLIKDKALEDSLSGFAERYSLELQLN